MFTANFPAHTPQEGRRTKQDCGPPQFRAWHGPQKAPRSENPVAEARRGRHAVLNRVDTMVRSIQWARASFPIAAERTRGRGGSLPYLPPLTYSSYSSYAHLDSHAD